MSAKRILLSITFGFALLLAGSARAEPQGATRTASASMMPGEKKAPPGFEPVAGAEKKTEIDPNPLVIGAYAMFFVLMFGYVVHVARSQAAIAREMHDLAKRIERMEKK
jgi:hypothetical protein